MGKRFIAATTLMSFLMATGLPALALTPAAALGNVESVSGQVVAQSDSRGWTDLQAGTLGSDSAVRTGADGQAIIAVGQSRVRLAPNTEVRLVEGAKGSELLLERGRLLGKTGDQLVVRTSKTRTTASKGDFVLETTAAGSRLQVLDGGNATLVALSGTDIALPALAKLPSPASAPALAIGSLAHLQESGEPGLLAEGPTKGKGVRVRDTNENVGADEDALPDQDVPPVQEQPPVVETVPPAPQTPPPATTAPATSPATTTTVAASGGGSGLGAAGIVGLVALLGGGLALALSGGDDDNDNAFVPGNPGVPSPSLP